MNLILMLGAVLLALLMVLPALTKKAHWKVLREFYATRHVFRLLMRNLLCDELGAVTVTYYVRGSGVAVLASTTGPTAVQASSIQVQKAVVAFGLVSDVQALITHNWGLDKSAPGYYDPDLSYILAVDHTYMPSLTFDFANTNVVAVNKTVNTGPCTVLVTLRRPSTEGQ